MSPRFFCARLFRQRLAILVVACVAVSGGVASAQDGYFHPTWGNGGRLMVAVTGRADHGRRLLPLADGRLVVVGHCWSNNVASYVFCATRLRRNGSYDQGFGPGALGYAGYDALPGILRAAALQPAGQILLAGESYFSPYLARVARLTTAGWLDSGAGGGQGFLQFHYYQPSSGTASSTVQAVAVQADGKVLVAGAAHTWRSGLPNYDFAIARLLPDLSGLDPSFGGGDGLSPPGVKLVPFDLGGPGSTGVDDLATAVAVRSDGRIWVAGTAVNAVGRRRPAVVRLLGNGQLDTSFGNGGRWLLTAASESQTFLITSAFMSRYGGLLMAGGVMSAGASGGWNFLLVRLLDDAGAASWNSVAFDIGGNDNNDDLAHAVAEQSDGRILLAGHAQTGSNSASRFAVARLLANGSIDTSFGINGRSTGNFSASDGGGHQARDIALDNGGLMVIGHGRPTALVDGTRFGIAKLRLDLLFTDGFQP